MSDNGLAPSTPNNGVLDTLNSFTAAIAALGQNAGQIYSSFLGARSTYELARNQRVQPPSVPTTSPANSVAALLQNKVVTTGAVLILGLTGVLIYKAIK